MTTTRIHEVLLDVRDAVEVPMLDEVALGSHVCRLRRRRATRRAVAAAATVAVVIGGPALWLGHRGGPTDPTTPTTRPATPLAAATALQTFPVSLEGKLETVQPDGSGYSTRDRVEEVLGSGPAGIVVISRQSHLLLVPLMASGQPDQPRDLADGRAVQRAAVDKSGAYVGFVDLDNRFHLRALGSAQDLVTSSLDPQDALLAVDATRWVTMRHGAVTVHTRGGADELSSPERAEAAQVAGSTVVEQTQDGVAFFDASDGAQRARVAGLPLGSLSPDGRWYVGAAGEDQLDGGAARDWFVVDTRTGHREVFPGRPARQQAVVFTWQDDDRFLALATDPRQPGNRVVSDCSLATQRCTERYNDPGNTLQIATR